MKRSFGDFVYSIRARSNGSELYVGGPRLLEMLKVSLPEKLARFEAAYRRYGPALASRFLLNYSHKLWGVPCDRLSTRVSGGRERIARQQHLRAV